VKIQGNAAGGKSEGGVENDKGTKKVGSQQHSFGGGGSKKSVGIERRSGKSLGKL